LGVAGVGRQNFVEAVDHLRRVQRFTDFQNGGMGEFGAGTEGEASIRFQALFAFEHQYAFGRQSIAHALGDALADPIEVRPIWND